MCFDDHQSCPAAQPPPAPPPSPRAARRTRTKTRRPRFLSLGRQLLLLGSPEPMISADTDNPRQLGLLPLHPLDKDPNVASLLQPDVDSEADQPSLAAILGASNPSSTSSCCSSSTAQPPPSTPSSGISWENQEDGEGLARRALRGREKWVFCKYSAEEAACSGCIAGVDLWSATSCRALSLKLDYEEILAAWSDRGSLYIDGEGTEMVLPEIDVDGESRAPVVFVEVGSGGRCGGWSKAEECYCGGREERVRRYKEKRRCRLFAKRIRYEVRKLNAEKRPRLKGRFVKRRDDL